MVELPPKATGEMRGKEQVGWIKWENLQTTNREQGIVWKQPGVEMLTQTHGRAKGIALLGILTGQAERTAADKLEAKQNK